MPIAKKLAHLEEAQHVGLMSLREVEFFHSLREYFTSNGRLSCAQEDYLGRLAEKYSKENIDAEQRWAQEYSTEHRTIALRCAHYYDNNFPRYYGNIVDEVLLDPLGHSLTRGEYGKMCCNKYAKKILAAYDSPVKFAIGDILQIRANNKISLANPDDPNDSRFYRLGNKICMVLEADSKPITRPAKGARIYKVLITSVSAPMHVHESDLKRARRSNK